MKQAMNEQTNRLVQGDLTPELGYHRPYLNNLIRDDGHPAPPCLPPHHHHDPSLMVIEQIHDNKLPSERAIDQTKHPTKPELCPYELISRNPRRCTYYFHLIPSSKPINFFISSPPLSDFHHHQFNPPTSKLCTPPSHRSSINAINAINAQGGGRCCASTAQCASLVQKPTTTKTRTSTHHKNKNKNKRPKQKSIDQTDQSHKLQRLRRSTSSSPSISQFQTVTQTQDSNSLRFSYPTLSFRFIHQSMTNIAKSIKNKNSEIKEKTRDIHLNKSKPIGEAEAKAEREVIEDSETWDDVSDDEQFKKKIIRESQNIFSNSPQNLNQTHTNPKNQSLTHTNNQQKNSQRCVPLTKSSLSLSGSGKGIWDIPHSANSLGSSSNSVQRDHHPPDRTTSQPTSSGVSSSSAQKISTSNSNRPLSLPISSTSTSHSDPSTSPSQTPLTPTAPRSDQAKIQQDSVIRSDINELVRDPAHALSRLKINLNDESPSSAETTANNVSNPLPWEAVIPTEIMKKVTEKQIESEPVTPKDSIDLTSSNYQRLPDTPSQNVDSQEIKKQRKFLDCLDKPTVDVSKLRELSWSGIPAQLRPIVWQILLGYLPAPSERRVTVLSRKRQEYIDAVRLAFRKGEDGLDQTIWHQIKIDVVRTNPGVSLWQFPATQRSLERILYVWAIRHPASGYVQGINDLVTPFVQVFLSSYIEIDPEDFDISNLSQDVLDSIEADSFWCLSKLLDGIQENYTFAQPGIQRQVARMKELCERVDSPLYQHLEEEKVEFIQFAFRWINCLLMRELSTKKIIRMWDTYLAQGTAAFSEFHLYVCLAFLVKHSEELRSMDFQSIIIFLQGLPTQGWSEQDLELLLSQAYLWHSAFQGATGHFVRK